MKRHARARVSTQQLVAYLDGELSVDEAAAVERSNIESSQNRRRLETFALVREALGAPVEELDGRDMAQAVREAARQRTPSSRQRSPWLLAAPAFGMAAALVLGIVSSRRWLEREDWLASEQVATSTAKAGSATGAERWTGVQVYRVKNGDTPERLKTILGADDGLLFSYTNLGAEPFGYLMIFAVDGRGGLHWFYPAAAHAGADPASIAIASGQAEIPLTELIRSELPQGPLAIYAAFTRQPLRVSQVEAWLKTHRGGGTELAPAGSSVTRLEARVEPAPRADEDGVLHDSVPPLPEPLLPEPLLPKQD